LHPEEFDVMRIGPDTGKFANNDLEHRDPMGTDHDLFAEGLRKSLFNYMHSVCLDFPLSRWFDFKVPSTSVPPKYIEKSIRAIPDSAQRPNAIVTWLGSLPELSVFEEMQGKRVVEIAELVFFNKKKEWAVEADVTIAEWLVEIMPKLLISNPETYAFEQLRNDFESSGLGSFEILTKSKTWEDLKKGGLLIV